MSKNDTIIRFEDISFGYSAIKPILEEVSFTVRRGAKLTLMGQNGAGKSTIFKLITGEYEADEGTLMLGQGTTIAIAKQVIPREQMDDTVRAFFEACFSNKVYDIDPKILSILEVVGLPYDSKTIFERKINSFSGGQQARLLLASALIQNPDILLLDEPTNNLDHKGIEHLTQFLIDYKKTVIVISHDATFLNAFTEGVLYLDVYTKKIEQYIGNYNDVLKDISARIEKENMKNAQLAKEIQAKKEKANQFAYKGGQMRAVAKKMREKAEELEEEIVDVRKEDKTIRPFTIPAQTDIAGPVISINSFTVMRNNNITERTAQITLRKNQHLLLEGPNGIGKSTLLESLAEGTAKGATITPGIRVGYYRQDFSTLDFNDTPYEALKKAMEQSGERPKEERIRSVAANLLITSDIINTKIGSLSEGQKGLVAFATLVLIEPGLLILDEPTNHINFRHLPIIAKALSSYTGAMILVSHVPEFVTQIRIDEVLQLDK